MHIDAQEPIADGIVFDDLHGAPMKVRNTLAARGLVFLTEFRANGKTYGGTIVAGSLHAAEQIAFGRALGETVIGTLWKAGHG